jgi:hypothetical protein
VEPYTPQHYIFIKLESETGKRSKKTPTTRARDETRIEHPEPHRTFALKIIRYATRTPNYELRFPRSESPETVV